MSDQRRAGPVLRGTVGVVGAGVLVLVAVLAVSTTIWPGQVTVTRHVLCDEDRPDGFVVSETYEQGPRPDGTGGGTGIRFSMYCVSATGVDEEVGWLRPVAVMGLFYAALAVPVVLVARVVGRRRSGPGGSDGPISNAP